MTKNTSTLEEIITIYTIHNQPIIIPKERYEIVSQYKWYAGINKKTGRPSRIKTRYWNKEKKELTDIVLHRLILGLETGDGKITDHIDGNIFNNRLSNLRLVTNQQNNFNVHRKRTGTTSKFKGVSSSKKCKRWYSSIRIDSKLLSLGRYHSEHEAALVYDFAAYVLFKEFACYNFKFFKDRITEYLSRHLIIDNPTPKELRDDARDFLKWVIGQGINIDNLI